MPDAPPAGLARLNAAPAPDAAVLLREVCASRAWIEAVLAGRPYPDTTALLDAGDAATAALDRLALDEALAGHPPIGRPAPGDPVSAREQRGMAGAGEALRAEMLELNLAYQRRFGHVFLIRATGLTAGQMRDAARARLGNTPEAEREVVRAELAGIHRIRLTRLAQAGAPAQAGAEGGQPVSAATVSTHILDTSAGRPAAGVTVEVRVRCADGETPHATAATDADGRCAGLPPLPEGATAVTLRFAVAPYLAARGHGTAFFPEVVVAFAVAPGEHHHVPLLLNPFGYSVYRGS